MSSIREPFPGWIDNYYGPISLYIGGGKGAIRVAYLNTSCHSNFVPVDIVVKAMLVVCWKLGLTTFTKDSNLFVLNCVIERRTTHRYDIDVFRSMLDEIPLDGTIWNNKSIYTTNFILFYILTMLLHVMPATLIDRILMCFGRRPMAIRLVRLLYVVSCVTYYFSSNNWEYSNINKSFLTSLIPPEEQKMFSFDYSAYDMKEYFKVHLLSTVTENIIFLGVLWVIYKWIYIYL